MCSGGATLHLVFFFFFHPSSAYNIAGNVVDSPVYRPGMDLEVTSHSRIKFLSLGTCLIYSSDHFFLNRHGMNLCDTCPFCSSDSHDLNPSLQSCSVIQQLWIELGIPPSFNAPFTYWLHTNPKIILSLIAQFY